MRKLTKKWQIFLYAISGLGINMLNLMMGSYLCSALLVGGFGENAIPFQTYLQKDLIVPAVWATFVVIAKIIDGVIDIPMASFTDGLRTKWGRRRPSILIGLIPLISSYLLFLVVPDHSGVTMLNTVYYGIMLCIFYSFYTLTMVTYYATFTEIVDNERDRALLANVKSVCDIVYFILGYVVVAGLLKGLNIRVVALIVLPLALTMLIPMFMIKEDSNKSGSIVASERVGLVKSLKHTFKNTAFIKWMVVYSFMTFGVQLFLGGINEYFSFVGMNMMFVMMASFAPVPFTLILYNHILHKYGFGVAFRYTLIIYTLGMTSLFGISFLADGTLKMVLSIVGGVISSFAIGSLFAVAYSIPSQLAAEEQEKTGVSNSAMYFAVQGLFSGVATGIGTGAVLTALKGSEDSHSSAIFLLTLISAAGTFVAFLVSYILPKTLTTIGVKEEKTSEKEKASIKK